MNYMGNSGRNTHNDMNRGFYKRPSPARDLKFRNPVTQPEATPKLEMIRMGPMSAGYDGGNTRPRGPDGRPLPFDQYPSRTVPIPIMDYTGNRTAMNKGLDNWGGHRTNDGTFRLEGYGDQNIQQGGGQSDYDYDYDDFYDNVPYSPGMEGPLYFS